MTCPKHNHDDELCHLCFRQAVAERNSLKAENENLRNRTADDLYKASYRSGLKKALEICKDFTGQGVIIAREIRKELEAVK